jgi:acetoin utilization protein AcuC
VPAVFMYSDQWGEYAYSPHHPLKPVRLQLTYELMTAYGLLGGGYARTIPATEASTDDLLRFHTAEYLDVLHAASAGVAVPAGARYGLGPGDNPIFPDLFRYSALVAGASLQAAQLVEAGAAAVAFNIAGGLHHGMPSRASGFCYVNDVVVAIAYLLAQGKRVAYVDIDTHHGDGVQAAYYRSNKVLTISLHESGKYLFPGTGFEYEIGEGEGLGYSVNVPFLPFTDDEIFTWAFRQVVPPLVRAFQPDVLVTQLGVDTFRTDPLAHLQLTTEGFCLMVQAFHELSMPWLALGGGGYDVPNVPRAWTLAWAIMNDRPLPNDLPEGYLESAMRLGYPNNSGRLLRDLPYRSDWPDHEVAWQETERVVSYLQEHVFPLVRSA